VQKLHLDASAHDFDDGNNGNWTMRQSGAWYFSQSTCAILGVGQGRRVLQGTYLCSLVQSRDTAQDDQRRRFQAAEKLSRLTVCREIGAAKLEKRKLLDGLGGEEGHGGLFSAAMSGRPFMPF
jgi:hypothetical protein